MTATPKYRPTLTAVQIDKILWLAKTETPILSKESMSLISTLAPFQAKIENSGIAPAYTAANKPSATSMEGLGAAPLEAGSMSKEDYWDLCFTKFTLDPTVCSLVEIQAAQEHRYLNDLMTPEEEAKHEESTNE